MAVGQAPAEAWYATALRAGLELIGWVGAPWALIQHHQIALAVLVDVLLIGLPALLQTPGDKAGTVIAVPGWATIAMVFMELGAAVAAAWVLFWPPLAIAVSVLALVCVGTEQPRWRRLLRRE